jgi:hypothetical protein
MKMENSTPNEIKTKHEKQYFRLTITYSDGETSGRVFKNREQAEKYAARQKRSPFVKKTKIEPFTTNQYEWLKARTKRQDEINESKN